MVGIWKDIFTSLSGSETSIALKTKRLGLKRGDFCRIISPMPGLRHWAEVMVSTVYRDRDNVDVIDYNHNYHRVSEFKLRKT